MGPMSIINHAIGGIVHELSEGLIADAVTHWRTLGKAMGRCASVCDRHAESSAEKCAECLAGKLISESNARHLSEKESQRYIDLARELKIWVDLGRG